MKKRIISGIIVLIPCGILFFIFVIPMTHRIINHGNIAGASATAAVMFIWMFYPIIKRKKGLYITYNIFLALFTIGCIYAVFLSSLMIITMREKPTPAPENGSTVIVLGCRIWGDVPSIMLARRLAGAHEYLLENENAVAVVTGGVGAGQYRSEACVMRDWLVNRGIESERIFLEELSTSTAENIAFAYDIIKENNLPENIVIVSDGFHVRRGKMIALKYFDEVSTVSVKTQPYMLATYWVREWFALTQEIVFN
jgi:uncharacterized SAM-binding protein YcdF (DUF218 family)